MESNERVEVIIELFREGHSADEIANLLGYKGKGGVSLYMRRHGYRWDWTIKNYVSDPSISKQISDNKTHNVIELLPKSKGIAFTGNKKKEIAEKENQLQVSVANVTQSERDQPPMQLTPEFLQNLKQLLAQYQVPAPIQTDRTVLQMKRYKGATVTKTMQIKMELSERLTEFVNCGMCLIRQWKSFWKGMVDRKCPVSTSRNTGHFSLWG